jgi:hypothetical protein
MYIRKEGPGRLTIKWSGWIPLWYTTYATQQINENHNKAESSSAGILLSRELSQRIVQHRDEVRVGVQQPLQLHRGLSERRRRRDDVLRSGACDQSAKEDAYVECGVYPVRQTRAVVVQRVLRKHQRGSDPSVSSCCRMSSIARRSACRSNGIAPLYLRRLGNWFAPARCA